MYRFLNEKPANVTIKIKDCVDRGGNHYDHPFIGKYALAKRLMSTLLEMGVRLTDNSVIPDEFFEKYRLMEVDNTKEDEEENPYVTSYFWYTCQDKVQGIELI